MESLPAVAFALVLGVVAALSLNAGAFLPAETFAERYRARGVLRPADMPDVDAPSAFLARMRRRERAALGGSVVAVAFVALLAGFGLGPGFQALGFLVFLAVFIGRSLCWR